MKTFTEGKQKWKGNRKRIFIHISEDAIKLQISQDF